MSVFVPTGADVAVDPLDVLLVAPNGTTRTTLYLAQGQPVVVAALPAAVVAELDAAADLVGPDTLFTTPVTASEWPSPIYIAGAQVKRVQSSGATQAGSMVLFALSGFMVTVPTVDLSDMVDLINATTTGGGGGGGGGASGGQWVPTMTPQPGCAVSILSGGTFIRSGDPDGPVAGDVVIATVVLQAVIQAGSPLDALVSLSPGLPDCESGSDAPDLLITVQSGDAGFYAYAIQDSPSAFQLASPGNAVLLTTLVLSLTISYRVAGS